MGKMSEEEKRQKHNAYHRQYQRDNRYGVKLEGDCRICASAPATDKHHIISQGRCKKIGRPEWANNPGNVVLLCRDCHDETTSALLNIRRIIKAESPERCYEKLEHHRYKMYEEEREPEEFEYPNGRGSWLMRVVRKGYSGKWSAHLPLRHEMDNSELDKFGGYDLDDHSDSTDES